MARSRGLPFVSVNGQGEGVNRNVGNQRLRDRRPSPKARLQPPCAQAELRNLLDCDESGNLLWKAPWGRRKMGEPAGYVGRDGYRRIRISSQAYQAYYLVYYWHTGIWPKEEIDHIDGNKDNNALDNLRLASRAENACNRGLSKNNTVGYRGVRFLRRVGKWQAIITKERHRIWLGRFDTPEAARDAYLSAAQRLYGDFCRDGASA